MKTEKKTVHTPKDIADLSNEAVSNLIHELEVHQIELKMQNDELRRLHGELEYTRDKYSNLYDFAPIGYITMTEKGIISESNLTIAAMLEIVRTDLIGKPFTRFVYKEDQDIFYKHLVRIVKTQTPQFCELRVVKKDSKLISVRLDTIIVQEKENQIQIRVVVSDITEREYYKINLEKIVETRTAELVVAKQEAEKRRQNAETDFAEIKKLKEQLEQERAYLKEEIRLEHNHENIIGKSDALKYVLFKVEQIAQSNTSVLVLGETGTGKELVARAIHSFSKRKNRALVKVNCAALPSNLIESELFGHEKGAFTGSSSRHLGRFEVADGTTLFLDEIGELPLELQAKLLRVIQDGEFERLGSSRTIKVDARIIAATNRNLEEEVQQERFRSDLWYRLNVFPITMPPLRDRIEDITLLVEFYIKKIAKRMGKTTSIIPKNVMNTLQNYHWPGNVRELENVLERAVINSSGPKLHLVDDLNKPFAYLSKSLKTLEAVERDYIVRMLEQTHWKVSGKNSAAQILGLNRSTLRARMLKLDIHKPYY